MKRYHLRMTIYFVVLGLIVGFVGFTCFNSWKTIISNKNKKIELEKQYNQLMNKEDELNDEVNKLQDPEYVAKYAREKYLYTKDGELIIDVSNN